MKNISPWFDAYVRGFYSQDESLQRNIRLKEEHSRRVALEAENLAERLELPPRQKGPVCLAALLHDVARFEQITRYRSFRDRETRDHGDWGAEIIADSGILEGYPAPDRRRILTAVRLHNKFKLPEDLDDETLLYCRIIRDADKIDIYHVVTSMNVTEDGVMPDDGSTGTSDDLQYNPALADSLLQGINADYRDVRSLADMYLLQLSWIFDLNFPCTLEEIANRGYMEKLMAKLPPDETLERVKTRLRDYFKHPRTSSNKPDLYKDVLSPAKDF